MTIREIETLTGMTRANIRFYESEGMLSPARGENGYRDYSQEDAELLRKIRLLRMLDIPLDEIKHMLRGERRMEDVLDVQIERLGARRVQVEEQIGICRSMRENHADFATLDAQRYIDAFGSGVQLDQDELPRVRAPWRRWFARSMDYSLYAALVHIFVYVVGGVSPLHENSGWESLAYLLMAYLLMLFIEPLLLSRFGTTPGKALLGLYVQDINGGRLRYSEALDRTASMMWRGQGWGIPVYGWIREWKCYSAVSDGKMLPWEADSVLELRDRRRWRWFAYAGARVLVLGILLLVEVLLLVPPNRGELTIAEFAENYNFALRVLEIDVDDYLDENGKWAEPEQENLGYYVFDLSGNEVQNYEFEFETEDGLIRAVRFKVEADGEDTVFHPARHLSAAMYAFVRAQKDYPLFGSILPEGIAALTESPMQSFGAQECGVQTSCAVESTGYLDALSMFWFVPDNEPVPEDAQLSIRFEMKLTEE